MNTKNTKIYAKVLESDALDQFNEAMALECNIQGALMADAHSGYVLPIGGVIKSKGQIFPSYVGYDIGCGVCAVRTSVKAASCSERDLKILKGKILRLIPLGFDRHKKKQECPQYTGISDVAQEVFKNLALHQIGTLGGGNHFIEIGTDDSGYLNIVIHSGSRGVGHKIAEHYMREAFNQENSDSANNTNKIKYLYEFDEKNVKWFNSIVKKDGKMDDYNIAKARYVNRQIKKNQPKNIEGHFSFDTDSELGKAYIHDMNGALQFALDNRKRMIEFVTEAMQEVFKNVQTSRFINRNHNHAEIKDGYVIHRKGATHADEGMMGVVPGNMKDGSFIVQGKGNPDSINSSSHGAGRILSRGEARRKLDFHELKKTMKNIVTNLKSDMLDESPKAYKNIFEVMKNQQDLVEIIDRIIPVLNIKG